MSITPASPYVFPRPFNDGKNSFLGLLMDSGFKTSKFNSKKYLRAQQKIKKVVKSFFVRKINLNYAIYFGVFRVPKIMSLGIAVVFSNRTVLTVLTTLYSNTVETIPNRSNPLNIHSFNLKMNLKKETSSYIMNKEDKEDDVRTTYDSRALSPSSPSLVVDQQLGQHGRA